MNESTEESQAEAKHVRKVLAVEIDEENEIDKLLRKFQLQKAVRVCAWIRKFVHSSLLSQGRPRIKGPLTTEETSQQRLFWERQAQTGCEVEKDRVALSLQLNQNGLLECRGRLQGDYPVYLSDTSLFARRVVEDAHLVTLHGGVGLTMAKVRSPHWIPRLRKLVKKVRATCYGCKRF